MPKFFDLSKFCPEPDIDFFPGQYKLVYFVCFQRIKLAGQNIFYWTHFTHFLPTSSVKIAKYSQKYSQKYTFMTMFFVFLLVHNWTRLEFFRCSFNTFFMQIFCGFFFVLKIIILKIRKRVKHICVKNCGAYFFVGFCLATN